VNLRKNKLELWIRTVFNNDPDPDLAFYFDADPDPDLGSQTNADPDPGHKKLK
jgi:hypothetical protein